MNMSFMRVSASQWAMLADWIVIDVLDLLISGRAYSELGGYCPKRREK